MATHLNAFTPLGPTSKIAGAATAPTGVTLAGDTKAGVSTNDKRQYRVQNNGAETAFYAYGVDASTATANAVIPTNASVGGNSFPLSAGGIEVITAPMGYYWSAITATNACAVFITPGKGI